MNELMTIEQMKSAIRNRANSESVSETEILFKKLYAENPEYFQIAHAELVKEYKEETTRLTIANNERAGIRLKHLFKDMNQRVLNEVYAASQIYNLPLRSCVYFIKNTNTEQIKIGMAINLEKRFNQLKSAFVHIGLPGKLKLVAVVMTYPKHLSKVEKEFHKYFEEKRMYGEWFSISEDEVYESLLDSEYAEFIEDVLVNYMDYESYHLETVLKDYTIPLKVDAKFSNDPVEAFICLCTKGNKLKLIEDTIVEHNIGFYSTYLDKNFQLHKCGIKPETGDQSYNIQDIKSLAMDRSYLTKTFKAIRAQNRHELADAVYASK